MRILFLCLFVMGFFGTCATQKTSSVDKQELSFEENEEGEYDIIVFDNQYEYYLNAIAKPINYYSESYLKAKNIIYVNEWNSRHSQPMRYDPNLYEVNIDYRQQIEYGHEFEYKLFNFFKFIEWKYKVKLDR